MITTFVATDVRIDPRRMAVPEAHGLRDQVGKWVGDAEEAERLRLLEAHLRLLEADRLLKLNTGETSGTTRSGAVNLGAVAENIVALAGGGPQDGGSSAAHSAHRCEETNIQEAGGASFAAGEQNVVVQEEKQNFGGGGTTVTAMVLSKLLALQTGGAGVSVAEGQCISTGRTMTGANLEEAGAPVLNVFFTT